MTKNSAYNRDWNISLIVLFSPFAIVFAFILYKA